MWFQQAYKFGGVLAPTIYVWYTYWSDHHIFAEDNLGLKDLADTWSWSSSKIKSGPSGGGFEAWKLVVGVSSSVARLAQLDHWSQLDASNDIKVARNLLVVTSVAPAAEWHAMCTDPTLDLLTKGNCANVCPHCRCWCRWLLASWMQSFVFGCFSLQYFTCFIVGTVSRDLHGTLRVSWKANLCDFRGVLFQESTRNEAMEAWRRVSCLLPLAGTPRCCGRARIGRYLVGGRGDVEATLCRGRPSCLRKSDSGKEKAPVLLRTSHTPSEFASYDRKIPFPGSLQVVNSHPTRVNRPVTEHLVSQSPPSHSKRLLSA